MTNPESRDRIPEEYLSKLKAARSARAMQGERRVVTILFCDVAGSTEMAEQLDPEDWAEIMDEAFDFMIAPIYRYEGIVARLMGDAILAFFGAPIAHEDDPQRAVLAALDILADFQPFRERIDQDYGLDFNLRVGLNTGSVVVGEIGSDLAVEYTAMGDAVNLAARMEQTAQPGTVQISAQTYKLVAPLFDARSLELVSIKGKSRPVEAYQVLGPKEQPGRLRGIQGMSAPLVGRTAELASLQAAVHDLQEGRGGIVALIGDAGLGKSRLIDEIQRKFPQDQDSEFQWAQHQGIAYDSNRPYGLFLNYIRKTFEVSEKVGPQEIQEKTALLLEEMHMKGAEEVSHSIALLLTVAANLETPGLEGKTMQRELYAAFTHLWHTRAQRAPSVMLIDDLHWADQASIDLLIHLLKLVEKAPLLILVAMRPHRQSPAWKVKQTSEVDLPHRYTEINLKPLSGPESDTLISGLLAISNLPVQLRDLILTKSDGNPFFVEEVIRTLIDRGDIVQDETRTRWIATQSVETIAIPDNLRALLTARIDRLRREDRATLQLASVIGRNFYKRLLQEISEQKDRLDQQLNTYQRIDLIRESSREPELEYKFVHELTREAAYHSMLRRERRLYHRRVASAIETLFPERLEEEAHRLGYHYEQAGKPDQAAKYYRQAGNAAFRIFANAEAISHFSRAIELTRDGQASDDDLIELYTKKGRAQELISQHTEALKTYQELEALGRDDGRPALVLAALIPQGTIHAIPSALFDSEKGRDLSTRSLALARQLGDPRSEARANWNLMLVENNMEVDLEKALEYGLAALAIARGHQMEEELAFILHDLSRTYSGLGDYEQALETAGEAEVLWRKLNNLPMLVDNLTMTASHHYEIGGLQQAKTIAEEALEISNQIESIWGQGYASNILGVMNLELGELYQGLQCFNNSLEFAERADILTSWRGFNYAIIGWLYGYLGVPEKGLPLAVQGLEIDRKINLATHAFLHHVAGNEAESREAYDELMGALDQILTYPHPVPAVLIGFTGELALAYGDDLQLEEALDQVLIGARERGSHIFLADMLFIKGRILQARGQPEEARQAYSAGLDLATFSNARRISWQLLNSLADVEQELEDLEQARNHRRGAQEILKGVIAGIQDLELQRAFRNKAEVRRLMEYPIS